MKNLLSILALSLAGLLLSANIASASPYNYHRGENPCLFGLANLKAKGYTENEVYTGEQIQTLLKKISVKSDNINTLDPSLSYQVAYSCYVDHQVAHATLQALPVNNPTGVTTSINWTFTKPSN